MRDSDGACRCDLVQKERNDAAGRSEDVAKADGLHAGEGMRRCEQGEFGDAFGCSHDADGIGCLVCGDEDHLFAAMSGRGLGEVIGGDGVVGDGGEGVSFHDGNVLECGCVKDDVRAVLLEQGCKEGLVADVSEDCDGSLGSGRSREGRFQLIQAVL